MTNKEKLEEMEAKFLKLTELPLDLRQFPITDMVKQKKDKEKSDEFGQVYTPIWLVDHMIRTTPIDRLYQKLRTLDLCSGQGQFTIRLLRALYNYDNNFDIDGWLSRHTFCEIQLENCFSLIDIFGKDINLFIGDAQGLCARRENQTHGIYIYDGYGWQGVIPKDPQLFADKNLFINSLTPHLKIRDTYPQRAITPYDYTVSNPPYTRGVDRKILNSIYYLINELVMVGMSTWLISRKTTPSVKKFRRMIGNSLNSALLFNGNPVFDIQLFVPVVVSHISKVKQNPEVQVNYFGDKYIADDINEITIFGSKWKPLVKPFFLYMKEKVKETGSIADHTIKLSDVPDEYKKFAKKGETS